MKPKILVARQVFAEVIARLAEHFDVEVNDAALDWPSAELVRRLQGKAGVFVAAQEPIDAQLLEACPELRAVCSMAVGYNNIDVAACTARGVLVTNAPDVLTETTADFGFALMMATARRIAESERYLRNGQWQRWAYDFFAGRAVRIFGGRTAGWPHRQIKAVVARKIASDVGRVDYCRVRLVDGEVEPIALSGASILSSTTRADGFVIVPAASEGYGAGTLVDVYLYD